MYLEPSTNYGNGFDLHKVIGNEFFRFHGVWDGYEEIIARYLEKTLPKAQRTQGIEYFDFDSFNNFSSKQKLQQALKSWTNK